MDKAKFGNFIADVRRDLGLTQQTLADQLHVTDKAVSKWERGLCYPDVTMLENLASALELTVGELMACQKDVPQTDMGPWIEIANESQKRQKKKIWLLAGLLALVSVMLAGLVVLCAAVNSSGSRYVSFVGKKTNEDGYFVYIEEGDRLLCLCCPDRQIYDTIRADKHQFYSIQYCWNRLTCEGTLEACKAEGKHDFFTPMDALGSSFGIESLLGVPYALQEIKNVYPDPHRQGKYLYTYRFFYQGDGTDYFLGQAVPETHILTVEDCRSAVTADYDEDGIAELFVLTKYENAPYMLHELEDGVITAYFIDEVPADVLENLKRAALDIM